jgi:hypothetical protein
MLDPVLILGTTIQSYYINFLNLNSILLWKYPLKRLDLLQPCYRLDNTFHFGSDGIGLIDSD